MTRDSWRKPPEKNAVRNGDGSLIPSHYHLANRQKIRGSTSMCIIIWIRRVDIPLKMEQNSRTAFFHAPASIRKRNRKSERCFERAFITSRSISWEIIESHSLPMWRARLISIFKVRRTERFRSARIGIQRADSKKKSKVRARLGRSSLGQPEAHS